MDRERLLEELNRLHQEKLGLVFQYLNHHYLGVGVNLNREAEGGRESAFNIVPGEQTHRVAHRFRQRALEALALADRLAERVRELGGQPRYEVGPIMTADFLPEMVHYNLARELELSERCQALAELAQGLDDARTRSLLDELAATERSHAAWLESELEGATVYSAVRQ